jgi:hypothetical protein
MAEIIKPELPPGQVFQKSWKIMLPRRAGLIYSALRFSQKRSGYFYRDF